MQDFTLFWEKMNVGGIVVFHDVWNDNCDKSISPWVGVTKAFKEIITREDVEYVGDCNRCGIIRRVK
jgi:hypothetical protein